MEYRRDAIHPEVAERCGRAIACHLAAGRWDHAHLELRRFHDEFVGPKGVDILAMPLDGIFSSRIVEALGEHGIHNLRQIKPLRVKQLMAMSGCGRKTISEIREVMRRYKIRWPPK